MLEIPVKIDKTFALSFDQKSVMRYVLYFDLFSHPVTKEELESTLVNRTNFSEVISPLIEKSMIFQIDGFYSLQNSNELVSKRLEGERLAESAREKAISRAKFIFNFPFVKGVYISGSMSKGVMEKDSDVDYFIITKPGRLWLSRTLLILFKKLFLFNSRKFFCLNYFIDSDHLEIEEQNVFTATELLTLIPVFQDGSHKDFANKNRWISNFYCNQKMKPLKSETKNEVFKSISESLFSGGLGNILDRFFMNLTMKVWSRKFEGFEPPDFDIALKSRTYVSKHHPHNYQKKVLDAFEKKKLELENKFKVDLSL